MSEHHISDSTPLIRGLSLWDATALVVGTIIGTGIFLKTAIMAQLLQSPLTVFLAWIVCGLLSLLGALTYAEIGSCCPQSGGEYAYLREGYGKLPAFLYGWTRFWIGSPATVAAYAVGAATFVFNGSKILAVVMIVFFTLINCIRVKYAGRVQTLLTALKILLVMGIVGGIFFLNSGGSWSHLQAVHGEVASASHFGSLNWFSKFGMAMIAALWAFDGWNNLPMVGEEIKDAKKNLPRALAFGVFLVLGLYLLANLAYFYAIPLVKVMESNSTLHPGALPVAANATQVLLGEKGVWFLSIAMAISALGAMHGSILTGARVPYAMAKDGIFFHFLANVGTSSHVPIPSVLLQGLWACVLALHGSFDQLTDAVIFSSWTFYALTCGTIFIFRKRGLKSTFKTWGYPWTPMIFIGLSGLLLINTIIEAPKQSAQGLFLILLGLPVYFFFASRFTAKAKK